MTETECRAVLAGVLSGIAPEADLTTVRSDAHLRTELDLDSMDFLGLVEGVCSATGVVIEERDYGDLVSIADWTHYLSAHPAPH